MPPPLPVARPRRALSALAWSLVWPGLGQWHNHQRRLGLIGLVTNTGLYLAAIPWSRIGRIYTVTQQQAAALLELRAGPSDVFNAVFAAAFAPVPPSMAVFLTVALIAALGLHGVLTVQAWRYARARALPPALPV